MSSNRIVNEVTSQTRTVGIIGCGTIVRNVHLPTLLNLSQVQVIWIADIDSTKGMQLSKISGVKFIDLNFGYSALPKADIVLLAIPYGARKFAYKHFASDANQICLFVEKPFAKSLEDHRSIMSPFQAWQVGVNLYWRSLGSVNFVKTLIERKILGSLCEMKVSFGGLGRILVRGGYMGNFDLAGGGALLEMGVHYLDTALFCAEATTLKLAGGAIKRSGPFDVHTEASFILSSNRVVDVPLRLCITNIKTIDQGIEFIFENAVARFDPGTFGTPIYIGQLGTDPSWTLTVPPIYGPNNHFALAATHWRLFLEAISRKHPTKVSADESLITSTAVGLLYALE
jgi:predicted dehydrogenase